MYGCTILMDVCISCVAVLRCVHSRQTQTHSMQIRKWWNRLGAFLLEGEKLNSFSWTFDTFWKRMISGQCAAFLLPSKSRSRKWWSQCGAEHHIQHNSAHTNTQTHTHRNTGFPVYLRGGWCLWHWSCLDNRLCKRICSRLWCRAPRRWRAAYYTSCRWSS